MNFNKNEIGEEIKRLLLQGYNTKRISDWADRLVSKINRSSEVYNILNRLALMEAGPEFEYTEDELSKIAELLSQDNEDPFNIVDKIKFKDFPNNNSSIL